mgnify:FL=1
MLFRSNDNLEQGAVSFIKNNDEVVLFSAYLKLDALKRLNVKNNIKQIIVRWEVQDLCLGVSDIELYNYCLDHNISLYRNTRIHLKAFWNNKNAVFFGSANLTGRGIGEKGKFNYELNGFLSTVKYEDIAYFNEIILNSEYVTSKLYDQLKNLVSQTKLPVITYPELKTMKKPEDYFLISNLPMTETVKDLFKGYTAPQNLLSEDINYVTHDMALYNIPRGLNEADFYEYLGEQFNTHPFVLKLKNHITGSSRKSLNYGSVVRWIQQNTTTVPTPRSWEIKRGIIVNILYDWICTFDKKFKWDTPNHSQVIFYKPIDDN